MYKRVKSYDGKRDAETEKLAKSIKAKIKELFPEIYKKDEDFKKKANVIADGLPNFAGLEKQLENTPAMKSDLEAVVNGFGYNEKPRNNEEFARKVQETGVIDINHVLGSVAGDAKKLDNFAKSEKLISQAEQNYVPPQKPYIMDAVPEGLAPVRPLPPGYTPPQTPLLPKMPSFPSGANSNGIKPIPQSSPWVTNNPIPTPMGPPSLPSGAPQVFPAPPGAYIPGAPNLNSPLPLPPLPAGMGPPGINAPLSQVPISMAPPGAKPISSPKPASVQQTFISEIQEAAAKRRKKIEEDERRLEELAKK